MVQKLGVCKMSADKILVALLSLAGMAFTYWFFLMKKDEVVMVSDAVDIIVEGGYSPIAISIPIGITKKTFPKKGIHCASCVYTTEKALKNTPGVKAAVVNLATTKATVTYDSDDCTPEQLADYIAKTGYALELKEKNEEIQEQEKKKELKILKTKVIASLFIGALIFWGSFPGLMNTSPPFLRNFFLQLLLATPIQFWAGLDFYKATIPALRNRTANMDTLVALGTTVAYVYSAFVTFLPKVVMNLGIDHMPYFDVAVIVIGLILLGRYFEAKAKIGTSTAIKKLMGLAPKTARVL